MYAVRPTKEGPWQVVDHEDRPVFTGSMRECEDWLDAWENSQQHQRGVCSIRRFGQAVRDTLKRWFGVTAE